MIETYFEDPRAVLLRGEALDALRLLPDDSVDALVTDPPSGIGFMGKGWDSDKGGRDKWIAWLAEIMREVLRVLKPGAHGLVWALPRTSHWTATALENAGFEVRDVHMHVFGTGMPKSLTANSADIPKSTGTALKPACEFWVLVRKPLGMTVSKCFAEHGTGVLNIDACRVACDEADLPTSVFAGQKGEAHGSVYGHSDAYASNVSPLGRWPAHVSFDEESVLQLAETNPGAERYFYVAKPSRSETELGCEHLPARTGGEATDREEGSAGLGNPRAGAGRTGGARNHHPTKKSIALMRWLCRLITPPSGLIIDPFCGSGSTGVAALHEGFQFLGVERDLDDKTGESLGYCEIIKARLVRALADTAKEIK